MTRFDSAALIGYLSGTNKPHNAGTNPIKKILSIILRYAGFELSDWLKNLEQPMRMLKNSVKIIFI